MRCYDPVLLGERRALCLRQFAFRVIAGVLIDPLNLPNVFALGAE